VLLTEVGTERSLVIVINFSEMKAATIFTVEESTGRGRNAVGTGDGYLGEGLNETTLVMKASIS
jgi:hypothetical protein